MVRLNKRTASAARRLPFSFEVLFFGLYFVSLSILAWISSYDGLVVDVVDSFKIFGIDDAYRFFIAKSAFYNPAVYQWGYTQPFVLFADGIILLFSQGNLLVSRIFHAAIGAFALFLIFRAATVLGLRHRYVYMSMLVVMIMPITLFIMLSFLSEFWLTVACCVCAYLFARKKVKALSLAASILPLIRPEGLIVMLPISMYFMMCHRLRAAFFCFLPGLIYFIYLAVVLDDYSAYYSWIPHVRDVINSTEYPDFYNPFGFFSTFNFFWVVFILVALSTPLARSLWPVWFGLLFIWLLRAGLVFTDGSFYEARYFVPALPVLSIIGASLLSRLDGKMAFGGGRAIIVIFLVYVISDNFLQFDPLRYKYHFERWPIKSAAPVSGQFYDPREQIANKEIRQSLEVAYAAALRSNVDVILIGDYRAFYIIDPGLLPKDVRVVYTPVSPAQAYGDFDGHFFGMFPTDGKHAYAYYSFFLPTKIDYEKKALLMHSPYCSRCSPIYSGSIVDLYLFNYKESVDI